MRNVTKKALSMLLSVILTFSVLPFTVFAENDDVVTSEAQTEFSTQSGLNQIVQNLSEAEDSQDYSITNLEMNGKKAVAVINNAQACKLVAAIYEEDSSKMLASEVIDVEAAAGEVEFEFDILSMPETYTVKVFLLDENNAALCDEYTYLEKTKAFKEFLAKEPEDFSGEDVLVFDDEKAQTDFAVLNDDVKTSSSKSITYSYNESTGKHTFRNADNTLKNLSAGDIYSYKYGDAAHEVVVIKVKEITVSGSTVTIVEDSEIGLGEAFSFVRIDAVGDYSSVDSSEAEYGSALTPIGSKKRDIVYEENFKDSWETSAELSYTHGAASVTGTVGCTFTSHVKLFYNPEIFGPDYYEFYTELVANITVAGLEVKGELTLPEDECRIESPAIPVGPFMLNIYASPIVSLSASFSCSVSYTAKTVVTADNVNGVSRTTTGSSGFEPEFEDEIEFRVGLELGVDLGWGDIVKLNGNCSFAVVWVAEVDTVGVILDKHHDCYTCVKGDNFIEVGIEVALIVKIIPEVMDFEWPAVKITREWSLGEFYCSLSKNGFDYGKGPCPNISYETKVKVYDKDAKNIEGATVFCATGYCDSNGDGKFEENTTVTDAEGEAIFYLNSDTHFIKVTKFRYEEAVQKVVIIESGKKVPIKLEESELIEFGSYPQSEVTNATLLSELNTLSLSWISYGYYSGTGSWSDGRMKPSDYMKYADVTYKGERYRAVKFTEYRPYCTGSTTSDGTYQDDNGYYTNTVYWFKFEPLEWRVLDPDEGFMVCESIIDSQPYNNTIYYKNSNYWQDTSCTTYASDYATSSIREWVNDNFYNTAFSSSEKSQIMTTTCNNSSSYSSKYDSATTKDKIFLLSYNEVANSEYGFDSNSEAYDTARRSQGTDYAKAQGLYVYNSSGSESHGNSCWWLRTPGASSSHACYVEEKGSVLSLGFFIYESYYGVRPALRLNLQSLIYESYAEQSETVNIEAEGETEFTTQSVSTEAMSINNTDCIAGNRYVLLNVSNYTEDFVLNSDDLLYIDMLRADANGTVSATFTPKSYDENSTILLIGDFGNGTEAKVITEGEADPEPETKGKVHSVSIDDISMSYKDGATITPNINADAGVKYTVTYSSSDTDVVSIDASGRITTNDKGSATITVTVTDEYGNTVTDTCEVNVSYKWWQWIIVIVLFGWIWY